MYTKKYVGEYSYVTLFRIASNWEQTKCVSTADWAHYTLFQQWNTRQQLRISKQLLCVTSRLNLTDMLSRRRKIPKRTDDGIPFI